MPLPPPTLSFTIPSYDNTVLNCRIYHPECLAAPKRVEDIEGWGRRAAIVAHPYATLGGSYDDPVVGIVAATILKQGFVVGTFNFRGAGKGRTSWTSQPEQNDYISFIGFMIYYMHHLSPPSIPRDVLSHTRSESEIQIHLSPIPSQIFVQHHSTDPTQPITLHKRKNSQKPLLLLAGYSYGALITSLLPPILTSLLPPFQTPLPSSPQAEIRLRAHNLATQQNILLQSQLTFLLQSQPSRGRSIEIRKSSGGVRVGGDEDMRRASHESFRSRSSFTIETHEKIRKSIDRVRSITAPHSVRASPRRTATATSYNSTMDHLSLSNEPPPKTPETQDPNLLPIPNIGQNLQIAYLLVSPLQGLVNSLATMFTNKPWNGSEKNPVPENEMKFTVDKTLVLFGEGDVFVSVKRLRGWAERLRELGEGGRELFRWREVEGAGHFWHTREAVGVLREEVSAFVGSL